MTAKKDLFAGLDHDLKIALRAQLRDLWTHTSTALEGNSLTLGDTAFISICKVKTPAFRRVDFISSPDW